MRKKFSDWKVEEILFDLGFYTKINIDSDFQTTGSVRYEQQPFGFEQYEIPITNIHYSEEIKDLLNFMSKKQSIYGYCPYCNKNLAFYTLPLKLDEDLLNPLISSYDTEGFYDIEDIDNPNENPNLILSDIHSEYDKKIQLLAKYQYFSIKTVCSLENSHIMNFIFYIDISKDKDKYSIELSKIGQNPSYTELNKYKYKRYSKLLKDIDCFDDYVKGINLYSHDIGIGSYVYLRRVIEKLLLFKFKEHKNNLNVNFKDFNKLEMNFKIETLQPYLPSFLTEQKNIYKILSSGIHILDENSCKEYFPVLKTAIDIILHQEEEKRERQRLEAEARKNINKISPEAKQKSKEIMLKLAGESI